MSKEEITNKHEYRKGFEDCKRIITATLEGYFVGLYDQHFWDNSALKDMLESITLKEKEITQ